MSGPASSGGNSLGAAGPAADRESQPNLGEGAAIGADADVDMNDADDQGRQVNLPVRRERAALKTEKWAAQSKGWKLYYPNQKLATVAMKQMAAHCNLKS